MHGFVLISKIQGCPSVSQRKSTRAYPVNPNRRQQSEANLVSRCNNGLSRWGNSNNRSVLWYSNDDSSHLALCPTIRSLPSGNVEKSISAGGNTSGGSPITEMLNSR